VDMGGVDWGYGVRSPTPPLLPVGGVGGVRKMARQKMRLD